MPIVAAVEFIDIFGVVWCQQASQHILLFLLELFGYVSALSGGTEVWVGEKEIVVVVVIQIPIFSVATHT